MPRKPRASGGKKKPPKPGKVTTSRLPVVKCGEPGCKWSKAILPGQNASKLLTAHYRDNHA
jgi:hypothetical protein